MSEYCYCPILKTRPAEINAYEILDERVKDNILPIIEMTGALGYTYPKNYKIKELQSKKRPGDINTKITKIYDLMQGRKFILDITDDEALMYDGLSASEGGLLDSTNGYEKWISFLIQDEKFKKLVIPTIQFDTNKPRKDIQKQIESLNFLFETVSIKLPALIKTKDVFSPNIQFNSSIKNIMTFISQYISLEKVILILDFGYIKCFEETRDIIDKELDVLKGLQKLKAVIPVSSCFPNFVSNAPLPIKISEIDIYNLVKERSITNDVIYGDFSSIHPIKYDMGGGGWIPRIDYIVTDETGKPIEYAYKRGSKRNTSAEYVSLARQVINSRNYKPVEQINTEGDIRIRNKANDGSEGKAPAYWIATRSNLYMTLQYLYLKRNKALCLSL